MIFLALTVHLNINCLVCTHKNSSVAIRHNVHFVIVEMHTALHHVLYNYLANRRPAPTGARVGLTLLTIDTPTVVVILNIGYHGAVHLVMHR